MDKNEILARIKSIAAKHLKIPFREVSLDTQLTPEIAGLIAAEFKCMFIKERCTVEEIFNEVVDPQFSIIG